MCAVATRHVGAFGWIRAVVTDCPLQSGPCHTASAALHAFTGDLSLGQYVSKSEWMMTALARQHTQLKLDAARNPP